MKSFSDHISKLQGELSSANKEKEGLEASISNLGSVDKSVIESLRREAAEHASVAADLKQELAELTSKFSVKEKQVDELTADLGSVRGKLEMTQVNLDQLRTSAESVATVALADQEREKATKVLTPNKTIVQNFLKKLTNQNHDIRAGTSGRVGSNKTVEPRKGQES